MTINRNGKKFILTQEEIHEAHEAYKVCMQFKKSEIRRNGEMIRLTREEMHEAYIEYILYRMESEIKARLKTFELPDDRMGKVALRHYLSGISATPEEAIDWTIANTWILNLLDD